jgi:hypothetical protein
MLALALLLNWPLVQPAQLRSVVLLPAAETNWPGTQSVCGVQTLALLASLYVPVAHAAQLRSLLAPPCWLTRLPGAHTIQLSQV